MVLLVMATVWAAPPTVRMSMPEPSAAPEPETPALPIVLLITAFAAGLGVLLGTANVFFRDLGAAIPILMQFWFWLTPIVYPLSAVPEFVRWWLALNPLVPLIGALQRLFTEGLEPEWSSLVTPALVSLVVCVAGLAAFRAQSDDIVDEL